MDGTSGEDYADRLVQLSDARWKRLLNVQTPYRWHLRRHRLGRTLDVGCGIGRNLAWLPDGSVGVDHNEASVRVARGRGLAAFTVAEWRRADQAVAGSFDSLLLAHVVEHMTIGEARALLEEHLPAVRLGGRVLVICPQERGFASDPTHVEWFDDGKIANLLAQSGLQVRRASSFPLPRRAGRVFRYNEFVVEAVKH
ncbi:class I SAM-dependent methyltransferase [Nocardioides sp. SOB77]|uniref:Class I SAM-dependent methyltransferase n=1 Tax=Nocardioides oceani TaxID=3058369 RepID=A0ABT8FFL8_9ACTN|nr:class I SAM-dependent methyltransferase [Nocardioides oceani]MDN4172962.1 class I SAM-dependent methyltransferase [Nocardioides oceani]